MLETQRFLCDVLFCLPGTHPWDYTYHFLANFFGVLLLFVVLSNAWRLLPKKVWKLSPKTSLLVSIVLACVGSATKEFGDIYRGRYTGDTLTDGFNDLLGIILASLAISIMLADLHKLRTFRFRHP